MSNLRIAYLNRADSATLTADPVADTDYPVSNLQNDSRGRVFRSTGVAAQTIKFTWGGTAYTVGYLRLDRHNLVTNDTLAWTLYPNDDWTGTPLYNPGAADAFLDNTFDDWDYGFSEVYPTASGAQVAGVKSGKVVITSSANPDGYIDIARLFVGPYTEAQYNPAEGAQIGWQGNSKQSRREGGTLSVGERAKWRRAMIDMMVTTEAQRAAWMEIGRYAMNVKTVCASFYPTAGGTQERDHSIMGKFEENPMQKILQNKYDFSLALNEI